MKKPDNNVRCTPEMKEFISGIDLIIFDIDGVLIDTRSSFIATIIDTTRFYINNIRKIPVDLSGLSPSTALLFKQHSGFNNDWDLTEAMILYNLYVCKSNSNVIKIESFLEQVDKEGGGLAGVYEVIGNLSDRNTVDWIRSNTDKKRIRNLFKEFYGGKNHCEEMYGFKPRHFHGAGSIESEKILLDSNLLRNWKGTIAILTGREKNETNYALSMLRLSHIDKELIQYADNILPDKPYPDKIVKIIIKAGSSSALFIGDSIDDYLTVENYNRNEMEIPLKFGLIAENENNFPVDARSFHAGSVNHLLEFILENNFRIREK